MQVRDAADSRTLLWAFVLFPLVPTIEYARPGWGVFLSLLPVTLYLSFTAGVFVHNQNHRAVFTGKKANFAYGLWLSVFYGFPIFSWIPTHNRRSSSWPCECTASASARRPMRLHSAFPPSWRRGR
jgi:fatty acid desaturase